MTYHTEGLLSTGNVSGVTWRPDIKQIFETQPKSWKTKITQEKRVKSHILAKQFYFLQNNIIFHLEIIKKKMV